MSSNKRYHCGRCGGGWVRNVDYLAHFKKETISRQGQSGGKRIANPCYGQECHPLAGGSKEEADSNKRLKTLTDFAFIPVQGASVSDSAEEVTVSESTESISVNPAIESSLPIETEKSINMTITSAKNEILTEFHKLSNKFDDTAQQLKKITTNPAAATSHSFSSATVKIVNDDWSKYVEEIKSSSCVSMKQLLSNDLIKNVFEIELVQEGENVEKLVCQPCKKHKQFDKTHKFGFVVLDSNYSIMSSGIKRPMEKWFSNLKQHVVNHLNQNLHFKAYQAEMSEQAKLFRVKDLVFKSMRHLSYFTLKSNLAFDQFPSLLATGSVCGLELGDLNHSSYFIVQFLDLVETELINKTSEWFTNQKYITVTLDIGTVYGDALLAVLFIGDKGNVKLADILPIESKEGHYIAEACFEACKLKGVLNVDVLKDKVVGITGDGAFAKGNKPFKSRISKLFDKTLTFRWDLLHLMNRAHEEARGKVKKIEGEYESDEYESEMDIDTISPGTAAKNICTDISELISFIQNSAKKNRSGIKYTQLKQKTQGKFRRPKVWSSTRMVVYEFDMVECFLDNSIYFDIPLKFQLIAQCHLLVMFALKIILKYVQKTNVTYNYVSSVVVGDVGKNAMKLALKVAVDIYNNMNIDYLLDDESLSQTDICNFPSETGQPKSFAKELYNYSNLKMDNLKKTEEPNERHTRQELYSIESANMAEEQYIDLFWQAVAKRIDYTDLTNSPCAYSEAPAEGIFSIYERVSAGRETLNNIVGLTRVAAHGPPCGTEAAAELSKQALSHYKSRYGERFCTSFWKPGFTSNTITKLKAKKWDW